MEKYKIIVETELISQADVFDTFFGHEIIIRMFLDLDFVFCNDDAFKFAKKDKEK